MWLQPLRMLNHLNSRSVRMKSLLIIFLGLLTALNVSAGIPINKGGDKRDTIQAVVQYGEEILFDAIDGLTDGQVGDLRDSVL